MVFGRQFLLVIGGLTGLVSSAACQCQPAQRGGPSGHELQATSEPSAPGSRRSASASQPPSVDSFAAPTTPAPAALMLADRGVFAAFAGKVELRFPDWLDSTTPLRLRTQLAEFLSVDGRVVAPAGPASRQALVFELPYDDTDGDGIPSQLDILIGAKKAALNGAAYSQGYRELDYPGGDVPASEGACTDVVVRALRNAGIDLQVGVREDIARAPGRYPMVRRADPNIDHRRVRTLVPYFAQHWLSLPKDFSDSSVPWLPGDILVMDTVGGPEPEHIGIVSDRLGPSGGPLVINNWTDGYRTAEMDILPAVTVTHRFRLPIRAPAKPSERGARGLLRRQGIRLAAEHRQLVLVTAPLWTSHGGALRRYVRSSESETWAEVGEPVSVRLGRGGLGRGRGLHSLRGEGSSGALAEGAPLLSLPEKREGDQRAPAGVFEFAAAFGPASAKPAALRWPWRSVGASDVFVDDPESPLYNTWQRGTASGSEWVSAEQLARYSLGLIVQHNMPEPVPGAGSAIFVHVWKSPEAPTLGCTAMDRSDLVELLEWLDPSKHPVLVQVVGVVL